MKNTLLLFLVLIISKQVSYAQTPTPGVTVITHGFTLPTDNINVWKAHAIALKEYAKKRTGQEATVFVNNPKTGYWEILDAQTFRLGLDKINVYTNSRTLLSDIHTTGEFIFLFDWSNDSYKGKNSLEANADVLFSMLANPVIALSEKVDCPSTQPLCLKNLNDLIYPNSSYQLPGLLLNRPTHFIGHSRGTVLLTQVINRFKKYYPNLKIDQFTTLDPHPAAAFGDIESNIYPSIKSLPYVFGQASSCLILCKNADGISLKIPENVEVANNFFRLNGTYESDFAKFDGILTEFSNYNYIMDDSKIGHSDVHNWYWGTFDNQLDDTFINNEGKEALMPKVNIPKPLNSSSWYTQGIISNGYTFSSRATEGFYFSRLGGGNYTTPRIKGNTNNTQKKPVEIPFNYNFTNEDDESGWNKNGGKNETVLFYNGSANMYGSKTLLHSYFIFPENTKSIRLKSRNKQRKIIGDGEVQVRIRDQYDNKIFSQTVKSKISNSFLINDIVIPSYILQKIRGKSGKIELYVNNNVSILEIDEFSIIDSNNSNLRVSYQDAISGDTEPTYFDFPVNYNVNPIPLIRGVRPNSFKATVTNSLSSNWSGTLSMTWRKLSETGRGIPLVSKGVSLAPNATVTLDRGTQQIISETGDYVLAIYANNDVDPIDLYHFHVKEPDELVSQTISVTPSSSNHAFGSVEVNSTKTQTFTIKNTSNANVSISNYALTGAGFVQGTTNCCGTLAPGQSYTANVIFQPTSNTAYSGNLQINGSFEGAPVNISLSGIGTSSTPPPNGCLESSISSISIVSGNTNAPKTKFFTLTNTSQAGTVTVNNIQFTGPDAQYFSYDPQLFSTPKTLNPALATGFMVKVIGALTQDRTYNATITFGTTNPQCPTLSLPISVVNQNSQVSWVGPADGYSAEYLGTAARFDLQWQGFIQGDQINRSVQIQYSLANGPWTHINSRSQNCSIGHDNGGVNIEYFDLADPDAVGKPIQFRIQPCNTTAPWQYSAIFHVIPQGFQPLEIISPNGYEVLSGGTTAEIKWRDLLGYQSVDLAYSTDNEATWQPIANNVSGQATYYRWQVPTGVRSTFCKVRISAANVSDKSDRLFTIQPQMATPISYVDLNIKPIGCGSTPNGQIDFKVLGGTPPYRAVFIDADGRSMTTNAASGHQVNMSGLNRGTNRIIATDANTNEASFNFFVPDERDYSMSLTIKSDTCAGGKGSVAVKVTGDFPFPAIYTFTKNGQQVYSGNNGLLRNLLPGFYTAKVEDAEGCSKTESFFIDSTPGTYFAITPTITNSSCAGNTGAISLNTASAQSPTFAWSNGTTGSSISNVASGDYSVTVTDNTGCVQNATYTVFETGGLAETNLPNYLVDGDMLASNGKLYFSQYSDQGNKLGVLDIQSNNAVFITPQSFFNPSKKASVVSMDLVGNDMYVVTLDYNPSTQVNETHFLKMVNLTQNVTSRVRLQEETNYKKVQFINGKLYALASNRLDICDFATGTVTSKPITTQPNNFAYSSVTNKIYIVGFEPKVLEFDVATNTFGRTANISVRGYQTISEGTMLYIIGNIAGQDNINLQRFDLNAFSATSSTPLRTSGNLYWGKVFVKDNRYLYIPYTAPKEIDIFDLQTDTKKSVPISKTAYSIVLDNNTGTIFVNGRTAFLSKLEDKTFDVTTYKNDPSCNQNNGAIALAAPTDGKTYTYLWSTGSTQPQQQNLAAGNYTVKIQQAGGCAITKSFELVQQGGTINGGTISPVSQQICQNSSSGQQVNLPQPFTLGNYSGNIVRWEYKTPTGGWINWDQAGQSYANTCCFGTTVGIWKVRAVVRDAGNLCPEVYSSEGEVIVKANPVANFTFTQAGNVITFNNTSTGGESYSWIFGDNTTSEVFSPVKSYATNGTYSVKLRSTNACSTFSEITKTVTITSVVVGSTFSVKSGSWHDPSTWDCNCVPNKDQDVEIKNGHTVTVSTGDANLKNLKYSGGNLTFQGTRKLCFGCSSSDLTAGLMAYYPFNGNANDASGNGNNGVPYGGATLTNDRKGGANGAYSFGGFGNQSYIQIPNSNSLQFTNSFSISLWYSLNTFEGMNGNGQNVSQGYHILFAKDSDLGGFYAGVSGNTSLDSVYYNFTNRPDFSTTNFNASSSFKGANSSLNTWVCMTYVVESSQVKIFRNGVLIKTEPNTNALNLAAANTKNLYLGRFSISWYPLNGKMDDVRVYNRALSDAEVTEIYNLEK